MSKRNDYYTDSSKKVIDFIFGFFLSAIAGIIGFMASIQLGNMYPQFPNIVIVNIIVLVLIIGTAIYLMKVRGRRYLGIGMLTPVIIFALVFGSCIAILVPKWG